MTTNKKPKLRKNLFTHITKPPKDPHVYRFEEIIQVYPEAWWKVALWLITFGKFGNTYVASVQSLGSMPNHINCRCVMKSVIDVDGTLLDKNGNRSIFDDVDE